MAKYSKLPTNSSHVANRTSLKKREDRLTTADLNRIAKARREERQMENRDYTGLKARLYERNQQRQLQQ